MDASILQPLVLIAVAIAIVVTLYEMSQALRSAACPECSHCRAIAEHEAQTQERVAREYARRVGLDDLASGQLVRVARREVGRPRAKACRLESAEDPPLAVGGVRSEAVDHQRLHDEVPDRLLRSRAWLTSTGRAADPTITGVPLLPAG